MNTIIRRTARLREAGPQGIGRGSRLLRRFVPSPTSALVHIEADLVTGLNDGDDVPSITDAGSLGQAWTASGSQRAQWRPAAANGQPALQFVSSAPDMYLTTPVLPSLATFTILIVQQTSGDVIFLSHFAGGTFNRQVRLNNSNLMSIFNGTTTRTSGAVSTARTSFSLLVWHYDGTTLTMRENGTALSGSGVFGAMTQLNELSGLGQSSNFINGYLALCRIVSPALSVSALVAEEQYYRTKYGLS